MDQTDSKHILAILMGALITRCVETCPQDQFQLPDSLCCLNCPIGSYVTKNCSNVRGVYNGVNCNTCRRCEEIGQKTVSNCTQFADTQCAMETPVLTHPTIADLPVLTHPLISPPKQLPQITMYGCSYVVVAVFTLAVIVAICFIRISKSGESDEGSAGEPLNIKDLETV